VPIQFLPDLDSNLEYSRAKKDQEDALYNHFMGALAVAAHDNEAAKRHYQQAVISSPSFWS